MIHRIRRTGSAIVVLMLMVFAFAVNAGVAKGKSTPEIKVQLGHSRETNSIVYSPDGKYIASGSTDDTIKLWNVASGKEIKTFDGHTDGVYSVVFSPDGKYIASGSSDKTIRLWDVISGKEIKTFKGHSSDVWSVSFSPDGKYIASGSSDNTIRLWNAASGKEIKTFNGHTGGVLSVIFSPDGKYIVSGSEDTKIKLWDVASGEEIMTFSGHSEIVRSVTFSPDGKYIASGSFDKTIKLWDLVSGKEIGTYEGHTHFVESVSFSPDGRYLVSVSEDLRIILWDVVSGDILRAYMGENSVCFSPDGKYIVSGSFYNTIKLLDVASGEETIIPHGLFKGIHSLCVSPDGRYISSDNGHSELWDIFSGENIKNFKSDIPCISIALSPDSKYLASGLDDDTIRLWDIVSGKEVRTLKGHVQWVESLSFSPDGRCLASGSDDQTIKLWDVASGEEMKTFTGHTNYIISVSFSPDGRYLASGSLDQTIKLWDVASGDEVKTFAPSSAIRSLFFSPDSKYLASGLGDNTIRLWDIVSGNEIRTFKGHTGWIFSVSFSPDGRYIVSGSWDRTIKIWDIASGRNIKTLKGHSGFIRDVTFSRDGKYIMSGSLDRTIRLWDAKTGELIYSTITTEDGRSLVWTPEGYFSGDEELARELVTVVDGMEVYSIDQFFEQFYRPDIVAAKIRGENISKYAKGNIKNFKVPPTVTLKVMREDGSFKEITGNDADIKFEDGTITVKVTATDTGGGISGVRLFCNEKAAGEDKRGLKVEKKKNIYEQVFTVALADGKNSLRAVGFSGDMTESRPYKAVVTYTGSSAKKPNMYVLSVGINEYKNSKYNLNYCVDDSTAFNKQIEKKGKKLFNKIIIKSLTNEDATRENVLKAIEEIKSQITADDVFIFFYAGHGIALEVKGKNEFYYVLHEITNMNDEEKCAQYGISGTEMKGYLTEIKATKQVMFVDACNSGAIVDTYAMRGAAEEDALAKLSRASGTIVFSSTSADQYATEFKELKHGVFTYVLIEALDGKAKLSNGQITIFQIKAYVDDRIPELTKKYKGEAQYPSTFTRGSDFPLGMD